MGTCNKQKSVTEPLHNYLSFPSQYTVSPVQGTTPELIVLVSRHWGFNTKSSTVWLYYKRRPADTKCRRYSIPPVLDPTPFLASLTVKFAQFLLNPRDFYIEFSGHIGCIFGPKSRPLGRELPEQYGCLLRIWLIWWCEHFCDRKCTIDLAEIYKSK